MEALHIGLPTARKPSMDMTANPQPSRQPPTLQAARLLRIAEVSETVGLCDSQIYALASRGVFPKPIRLSSRCSRWRASDILTWLEQLQ